jgi:hypothetical protein
MPGRAATIVAKRVVREGDWRGSTPVAWDSLRNWIAARLKSRKTALKEAAAWREQVLKDAMRKRPATQQQEPDDAEPQRHNFGIVASKPW